MQHRVHPRSVTSLVLALAALLFGLAACSSTSSSITQNTSSQSQSQGSQVHGGSFAPSPTPTAAQPQTVVHAQWGELSATYKTLETYGVVAKQDDEVFLQVTLTLQTHQPLYADTYTWHGMGGPITWRVMSAQDATIAQTFAGDDSPAYAHILKTGTFHYTLTWVVPKSFTSGQVIVLAADPTKINPNDPFGQNLPYQILATPQQGGHS